MPSDDPVFSTLPVTKGVVIYSPAARTMLNLSVYASVEASHFESDFHVGEPPFDIPTMVGLPIYTRNFNFYSLWDNSNPDPDQFSDSANPTAQYLNINGNLDDPAFGVPTIPTGNIYVFRTDGINLLPQHLEALIEFCPMLLDQVFLINGRRGLATDPIIRERQKQLFRDQATREGFLFFFWRFRAAKLRNGGGPVWKDLPSPYDKVALGGGFDITTDSDAAGLDPLQSDQPLTQQRFPLANGTSDMSKNSAQGSNSKKRKAAADNELEAVYLRRTIAPTAKMTARPQATRSTLEMARPSKQRPDPKKKRVAAEGRITPSIDLASDSDDEAVQATTSIRHEKEIVNKVAGRKRRRIGPNDKASEKGSNGEEQGVEKNVFQQESEEAQSRQNTAEQLIRQASSHKFPSERRKSQAANQNSATHATPEHDPPSSPMKQAATQAAIETDRTSPFMINEADVEPQSQRILSDEELMEQKRLYNEFINEHYVAGQDIDPETGLLELIWRSGWCITISSEVCDNIMFDTTISLALPAFRL